MMTLGRTPSLIPSVSSDSALCKFRDLQRESMDMFSSFVEIFGNFVNPPTIFCSGKVTVFSSGFVAWKRGRHGFLDMGKKGAIWLN